MDAYIGQITLVGFKFAPEGWAFCQGGSLPIAQNQALYALIYTTYGGTSQTFNLPDLQGRAILGTSQYGGPSSPAVTTYQSVGKTGGLATVTLTNQTTPAHNHLMNASTAAGNAGITGNIFGMEVDISDNPVNIYAEPPSTFNSVLSNQVSSVGGTAQHNNMQPYLVLNPIISLRGYYPQRP